MRLAFEANGCECVFACDWDKYARQTYERNFRETPAGDIHTVASTSLPNYDILTAGFPCQPFSISGVSKKNSLGRPHGFEDRTQGTLFFELARILRDTRPSAFLLENVKNILNHDKGRTIDVIYETLRDELRYNVHPPIVADARKVVPQHRERVFIIGFRGRRPFTKPDIPDRKPKLAHILEKNPDPKYTLTAHLWSYLQSYAEKHRAAGNGFGFGLADLNGTTRTLSARYYKDGSEILIPRGRGKRPRRLTPRECARLMGFPDAFEIPVSDTQAYKQFGNSVVVPVVSAIAAELVRALKDKNVGQVEPFPVFRPKQLSLVVTA